LAKTALGYFTPPPVSGRKVNVRKTINKKNLIGNKRFGQKAKKFGLPLPPLYRFLFPESFSVNCQVLSIPVFLQKFRRKT